MTSYLDQSEAEKSITQADRQFQNYLKNADPPLGSDIFLFENILTAKDPHGQTS